MPCLNGEIDPAYGGIIIPVFVHEANSLSDPNNFSKGIEFKALVDTGASRTAISPKVIDALKLLPSGQIEVHSATGAKPTNTYIIDMLIRFGKLPKVVRGNMVTEFIGTDGFDILLGMDIIIRGSLHISNDGHYTFCL